VVGADRGIARVCCGHSCIESALEISSAKEAKRRFDCGGKHLGCPKCALHTWGGRRITVRTKWQSGNGAKPSYEGFGNTPDADLMGNHLAGNGRHSRGKSGPT
jgi:hypothetical protein